MTARYNNPTPEWNGMEWNGMEWNGTTQAGLFAAAGGRLLTRLRFSFLVPLPGNKNCS